LVMAQLCAEGSYGYIQ
jgi:hypothetical protein